MEKVRVGILGAGFMGMAHASCLLKIPHVEIIAVCDADKEKAMKLIKNLELSNAIHYDDPYKMIDKSGINTLYVCIPPFAHAGQVEAAAKNGIHIFIEKPISLSVNHAEKMVSAVKEAGVISQVGYQMRFGAAVQKLKEMIDNGKAGLPTLFDGRYECNSLHTPWWKDREKSGGQIFEQLIHMYDLSMYLLGDPDIITGFTSNLCHKEVENYTIEDTSVSAVRFKSGALMNMSGTNCAVPMKWNNPFTVVCKNVTVYFTDPNNAKFIYTSGKNSINETISSERDLRLEENIAFISAVLGEKPALCPIEQGLKSLKLVDLVTKSAELGGTPLSYS